MDIDRRRLMTGTATALLVGDGAHAEGPTSSSKIGTQTTAFASDTVTRIAQGLARQAYQPPDTSLPAPFDRIDYDGYRDIEFKKERALWHGENLPFQVQFFQRASIHNGRVEMFEVADGAARRIPYSSDLFTFGQLASPTASEDLGFAGLRIHAPLNKPDTYDEVATFQGASYFRAVAKGGGYGLSARGLAIRTGAQRGEEFPDFRAFWIEKPAPSDAAVTIHALLDSASTTGAYRFTITPGDTTAFDVTMVLFPRVDIAEVGVAPNTSMFLFDTNDRGPFDDFRTAVHDSDGLKIHNGQGEELWRPLTNPPRTQANAFVDVHPRGFGLIQRDRRFAAYEDLEAQYERRPSLWVKPKGDWGAGAVHLVEIPTSTEFNDNIVAYWRPQAPLRAELEYRYAYRLQWGPEESVQAARVCFTKTRIGAGPDRTRRIVIDARDDSAELAGPNAIKAVVSSDKGVVRDIVVRPNRPAHGWRISFILDAEGADSIELRGQLTQDAKIISEVWLYRWAR